MHCTRHSKTLDLCVPFFLIQKDLKSVLVFSRYIRLFLEGVSCLLLLIALTTHHGASYTSQDGKPVDMERGKEIILTTDYEFKGDADCFAIR